VEFPKIEAIYASLGRRPAVKLTDNGLIGQLVANDAKLSRNTFV
jgi:hypothetical protein